MCLMAVPRYRRGDPVWIRTGRPLANRYDGRTGVVMERSGSEAEGWRYWVDVFYHRTWEFDEAELEPREPEPAFKWR